MGDVVSEEHLSVFVSAGVLASHSCSYLRLPRAPEEAPFARLRWLSHHCLYTRLLASMDIFCVLRAEQIEELVRKAQVACFEPGAVVSPRGSTGPALLWIIAAGEVSVTRPDANGGAKVEIIGRHGSGWHFGAKNIVDSSAPRLVDIIADTALVCLTLDLESFGELLPLVQHSLARELANRRWILENRHRVTLPQLAIGRTIGIGSFGRVKLVLHTKTSRPYALKVLTKTQLVEMSQVAHVRSEQTLLSTCSHPFLLKLAAAFQDETRLYMVLEFLQGGEVLRLMEAPDDGRLPLASCRFYAASVTAAFSYLHSLNIVYRDLKPENMLLDAKGTLKLIDFGFAKILTLGKTFTACGTPDYMAPEIIRQSGHALPCDWWSLGVVLFEMLTGIRPFDVPEDDASGIDTLGNVLAYARGSAHMPFPEDMDAEARALVTNLCAADTSARYDAERTRAHAFFASINFMALENGQVAPPHVPLVGGETDTSNFEAFDDEDDGDEQVHGGHDGVQLPHASAFGAYLQVVNQREVRPPIGSNAYGRYEEGDSAAGMVATTSVAVDIRNDKSSSKGSVFGGGGGDATVSLTSGTTRGHSLSHTRSEVPAPKVGGCCVLQ